MKSIKEYKVVMAQGTGNLETVVNSLIAEGWQPIGGVFITQSPVVKRVDNYDVVETFSHQALVR
ncbi:hypothetical protein A5893_17315 [Pedobacter psychrophilus]|uniref:Uncharacterized protein n=2 Tax=Pedobacter psychrophilus TaxID=1826909 RepID=A0A179DP58_9SPHI|nr:DUF1737 domain-containing protein [Pedobacter psychrophilus]OAQ42815.1 hypothetical protein A5893_17315 [Pedobacter psychrophilus]